MFAVNKKEKQISKVNPQGFTSAVLGEIIFQARYGLAMR
jgi:hypothetical protein